MEYIIPMEPCTTQDGIYTGNCINNKTTDFHPIRDIMVGKNKMEEEKIIVTKEQHEETKEWLSNIKDRRKMSKAIQEELSSRARKNKKTIYKCENCGFVLSTNWLYCPICGRKIDWRQEIEN